MAVTCRKYDADGVQYFIADPDDSATYTFDYADNLASGETVSSAELEADAGITAGSPTVNAAGDGVEVVVSGGTVGTDYDITCKATMTPGGRVRSVTARWKVRER